MAAKPFVQDTLFYLNISGLNPFNQTSFTRFWSALVLVLGTIMPGFTITGIILAWDGVDSLREGSDSALALVELIFKLMFLVIYRQRLRSLLNDFHQFWPVEEVDKKVQEEIEDIYSFVRKFLRAVQVCYWSTCISYFLKPLFTRPREFAVKFYQPVDLLVSPRYEIVYSMMYVSSTLMLTVMLSFLFLFVTFVTHVVCELKMLKYKFANLEICEEKACLEEVSKLAKHHGFILRFIENLNGMYSMVMLSQFVSSICLGLFNIGGQGFPPTWDIAGKYALFLVSYISELYIFCFGGNVIAVESASVADAVYQSDWWLKTQPKMRRAMALVMLRAQKVAKLTVGGMFDLDLECFTTGVRASFSFFTFMQAMQSEDSVQKFT